MTDTPTETPANGADATLTLEVNGATVEVPDAGWSLLDVLRHHLGLHSAKDGCSPQGQCGCCTVLVDGSPRVACVTPARRVRGRSVVTLDGLDDDRRQRWGDAFCAAGGSQCGFCTPGIVLRLEPLVDQGIEESAAVDQALLAHLCRCTGWQTIGEAYRLFVSGDDLTAAVGERDLEAAARRATIEGRTPQQVSPEVAIGSGGFAADLAPADALIAVADGEGGWVVADSLAAARAAAGKVQGRRTTATHRHPLDVPSGEWAASLRTTWVDGAYLETDASWCVPGGEPASPVANGGAFGAKATGEAPAPSAGLDVAGAARRLADEHGRPVLVLASREDVARSSPKRPPVAGGLRADGTGSIRVVDTPGITEAIQAMAPGLEVELVEVAGPPTSAGVRAAGWAEAAVLLAGATGRADPVHSPDGAEARAEVDADGSIRVSVRCGQILDATVLRSYCIGAAHMAWSWLTSEAMLVDEDGTVHDLTIRSFGVLRAVDTPPIEVELIEDDGPPVNGSDAVFAAVAAAGWLARGQPQDWPIGLG